MAFDDNYRDLSIGEMENANTDRSVNPAVMVRGIAGRDELGTWRYISVSSANSRVLISGSLTSTSAPLSASSSTISAIQGDAGLLRVSALGVTVTTSPLSADSSSISAIQGDAGKLVVSSHGAYVGGDKLSAYGGFTNVVAGIDVTGVIRAIEVDTSGNIVLNQADASAVRISSLQADAGLLRVSAIGTVTVSAHEVKQSDAAALRASAINQDANFMHVSAVGTITVSAHEVKQSDAAALRVSAVQGDAGIQRVSAILAAGVSSVGAASFGVSAAQNDAGALHISAFSTTASTLVASAAQGDAGVLRVSADMFADTIGSLTVFQTLSVSASQSVKGTAGALYGYYLYNSDSKPNYVKFYNVSAAANIGTDTPLLTIMLPASAAANAEFAHGIKGFTAGINITATSGRPLDNTAAPAASSVGATLLYV